MNRWLLPGLVMGLLGHLWPLHVPVWAQCCGGSCEPPWALASVPYEWKTGATDPDQVHLFCAGRQIGSYRYSEKAYYPFDGDRWSNPSTSPVMPPTKSCVCGPGCPCDDCHCGTVRRSEGQGTKDVRRGARDEGRVVGGLSFSPLATRTRPSSGMPPWMTHGVVTSEIHAGESYHIGDRQVSRQEAMNALAAGHDLTDDSKYQRLTVIGTDAERQQVLTDLATSPVLAPYKGRLVVQDYPPDHWAVRGTGFVTTGKPTIYVQAADGKVLHRQDEYRDGAEGLAVALRKTDPSYDPAKDADQRKTSLQLPTLDLSKIPPLGWLGIGVGLTLLFLKKGRS